MSDLKKVAISGRNKIKGKVFELLGGDYFKNHSACIEKNVKSCRGINNQLEKAYNQALQSNNDDEKLEACMVEMGVGLFGLPISSDKVEVSSDKVEVSGEDCTMTINAEDLVN